MMIEHRTIGGIDKLDPAALRDIAVRFAALAHHFDELADLASGAETDRDVADDALARAFDGLDREESRLDLDAPITRFANVVQSVAYELSTVWPMP